jgi:hypothetical protein
VVFDNLRGRPSHSLHYSLSQLHYSRQVDALVNIEVDVLAKMVETSATLATAALQRELVEVRAELAALREEIRESKK